ncbi:MAG: uracil-DNA glycosylase [Planctomycetaceae bacterium]|nr:uracil-DNA glycosylase [Planctomycetales bacterium]MCB9922135.1 uracil-DNA glycosylase [Planctomycetaceae bacterium]
MKPTDASIDRIKRIVVQRLEALGRAGVVQLPRREATLLEMPVPPSNPEVANVEAPEAPRAIEHERPEVMKKGRSPDKAAALAVIQQEVAACTRCEELACTRTQTVFGVGDPNAKLCFFGEAPGADEDRQGEPFVGRAGKLLTDIIVKGMGLERSEVYILNVLKCRPPGNRNPSPEESANCREFFERQFDVIRPKYICCLGTVAAQNLLQTTTPVGKLRGTIHEYQGAKVVVTYHPSYLLRNPSAKKFTWDDIRLLLGEMGLPVPKRS